MTTTNEGYNMTEKDFRDALVAKGRGDNFSHWGLNRLWDYFKEYEDSTGEEIELDVIAICCKYKESTWEKFKSDYPDYADFDDNEILIERLAECTQVVAWDDDRILYQAF